MICICAAERPQLALRRALRDVGAAEADRPDVALDQPEDRLRGRRLAAAGLADERDHLAPPTEKRDAVDGVHGQLAAGAASAPTQPARDRIAGDEVLDLEQRRRRSSAAALTTRPPSARR